MTGKTRSSLLSLAIIAVLVFGAISPTIAYADDDKPPATAPTQVTSDGVANATSNDVEAATEATSAPDAATAAATSTSDEATAVATSTPDESATAPTSAPDGSAPQVTSGPSGLPTVDAAGNPSGDPAATPPPTEEAAPAPTEASPAPTTSVLEQIPVDTTVTVLDAQGQSQPLATQDAAAAIATTSDPIWCPQGQTPTPGANGCTNSFTSFTALLTFLSGNATYQGAGVIYVQQGNYTGGETSIDFNSPTYDLSNIRNADLTITGGWNTSTNAVDPTTTSDFTIPILIGTSTNPWGGSLFIGNITINNTNGTGLTLYSQNDIGLTNVTVTKSQNGAGAELNAGRDVTIRNSKFEQNKTAGALIRAKGDVAIRDSSFSNPANARRQHVGLDIVTDGSVALRNVLANQNREVGATITAGVNVAISTSFFSDTKSMDNPTTPTTFWGYGLKVVAPGAIDLSGVEAMNNFLWGASLDNCIADTTGACTGSGDIAIADSKFNANTTASPGFIDDTGLLVTSSGSVALRNVQANANRLIGATITARGSVDVRDSSFSNNNGVILSNGTPTYYGYGLQVVTPGSISLNGVTASNNTLFGAHLESGADVSIANSNFNSNSNFNNQNAGSSVNPTGRGLEIIAGTDVNLNNVLMNNNQLFGGSIQAGSTIFLTTDTATGNGTDGLDTQGNCTTVDLIDGTYSNNGGYGLSVVNAQLTQLGSPVFGGNGTGDVFQNPGSCVFPAAAPTGGAGNGTGTGPITSNSLQGALQNTSQVTFQQGTHLVVDSKDGSSLVPLASDPKKISLNIFLAQSGTNNGDNHLSVFVGNYAYIYFNFELHIIAFVPASDSLAMGGS